MCERNIHQLPLTCPQLGTWPAALTGSRTGELLLGRLALNPLSHTNQDGRLKVFKVSICFTKLICRFIAIPIKRKTDF